MSLMKKKWSGFLYRIICGVLNDGNMLITPKCVSIMVTTWVQFGMEIVIIEIEDEMRNTILEARNVRIW